MKKIITLAMAILVVSMVAALFYGCGNDNNEPTTTTTQNTTTDTTMDIVTVPDKNDGIVSDVSDENGLLGDIVTDVSEGISEGMSDIRDAVE